MNPRNRTLLYGLGCVVAGILSLLLVVMPIRLRMAESPGIAEVVTAVIAGGPSHIVCAVFSLALLVVGLILCVIGIPTHAMRLAVLLPIVFILAALTVQLTCRRGTQGGSDVSGGQLHEAVAAKDVQAVEGLLAQGASVDTPFHDHQTPLMRVPECGAGTNIALVLIEHGADVNKVTAYGDTPLIRAVRFDDLEVIRLLLAHGADPDVRIDTQLTPLEWAVDCSHTNAARLLLENAVNANLPNFRADTTPLLQAVYRKDAGMIRLLLRYGADPNQADRDGRFPLLAAGSAAGPVCRDLVEALLKGGADANREAPRGDVALHHTFHPPAAALLIKYGARVNKADRNGVTPLLKVTPKHLPLMQVLLERGADPDTDDRNGQTPLLRAAAGQYTTEHVLLLVEHGADVNKADKKGRTPLMAAADRRTTFMGGPYRDNGVAVARLLLQHGADVHMVDSEGKSALAYAASHTNRAMQQCLARHGASWLIPPKVVLAEGSAPDLATTLSNSAVIVLCDAAAATPSVRFGLLEVWRDESGGSFKGRRGRLLRDLEHDYVRGTSYGNKAVAFYKMTEDGLRCTAIVHVYKGKIPAWDNITTGQLKRKARK